MKTIIFVAILSSLFVNILAQKTITCRVHETINGKPNCGIQYQKIGPNETVSIETYPENTDANSITYVWILSSTIPSIPSEIFTKFPNLKQFECTGERVQEIKRETFWHGIHLETINVQNNELTFLHKDTFKGENFPFDFIL
jgi:hypothetical protein